MHLLTWTVALATCAATAALSSLPEEAMEPRGAPVTAVPKAPTPFIDLDGGAGSPAGPDPDRVIATAKTPFAWVRGHRRALLIYRNVPRGWWPSGGLGQGPPAISLTTRTGTVLARWSPPGRWAELYDEWWPARGGFVGGTRPARGSHPVFVNARGVTSLTPVPGRRVYRSGDIRYGHGMLLNLDRRTVTTERLPQRRCRSVTVDVRGRVWCLNRARNSVSWTDGRTWTTRRLSTSYRWYCDGGTRGATLNLTGGNVAIGLWRADFTTDRGRTWHDVDLPFALVGARDGVEGPYEANCTVVEPLRDGRLHLSYFKHAVATSTANSDFTLVKGPRRLAHSTDWDVVEGTLVAPVRRAYGHRLISYDGGQHWQPLRVRVLVRHLFR